MIPRDFDINQAAYIYGLANTPHFLLRKLQSDPSVRAIADTCAGEDLVNELRSIVAIEPTSTTEAVRPYVYLVALWLKSTIDHLQEAANIAAPIYNWYSYIAEVLVQTFSPVEKIIISLPGVLDAPSVSQGPTSPITSQIITAS